MNHRKELRTALAVLALLWLVAGLCYLIGLATLAFIVAIMGAVAASERFFRVVANSPSLLVRIATSCVWLAVIAATFGLGVALLLKHGLSHAGS